MKMIIPVKIGKMNLDTIICVLTKCFIWSVYGFTFSKKLRPKKKTPSHSPCSQKQRLLCQVKLQACQYSSAFIKTFKPRYFEKYL